MRIVSATIPAGYAGLKENHLTGSGELVVLAGPNGSGKTRLLRAVESFGKSKLTPAAKTQIHNDIQTYSNNLDHYRSRLSQAERLPVGDPQREGEIEILNREILSATEQLNGRRSN